MEKPKNPREYIIWWNENFDTKIDLAVRKLYDDISTLVKYKFEHSDEYKELIHQLHNHDAEYRHSFGYDLLMKGPEEIELDIKNWERFRSKVWRKNVVHNINWNKENWNNEGCQPNGGWITPDNWFEKIHDIVRTRIVVKYFDGVEFLLDKMCNHFRDYSCRCEPDWEAREEGYYAAHLNVTRDYELPVGLEIQKKRISVEIQVTTQMKDVITSLTHEYYERKRERLEPPDIKWQWDYKSDEFLPNYIGHILHYIEGAVMQIRNREQLNGKR
jgi:ppGpp synthetase/RelA/SpoT-type nucleotidyltranferase